MAKRRLFESLGLSAEDINIDEWESPNISGLPDDISDRIQARVLAVTKYITGESTLNEIKQYTGLCYTDIYRFVKRCLNILPNGQFAGFNALIPWTRIEPYRRVTKSSQGRAGKLQQLFSDNPELEEYVVNLFLGKRIKGGVREPQMKHKVIHEHFLDKCAVLGKSLNDYPFNTKTKARESLRVYLNALKDRDIRSYVQGRHGPDAARRIDATKVDTKMESDRLIWEANKPYQDIQLDEHVINVLMIIYVQAPDGAWIPQLFDRLWIIVPIDSVSRAVLGYQVCLTKYNSEDVLTSLANSIEPNWKPRELTIPKLQYKSGAGFPSSSINEYAWRLFDRLSMDNDRCHLSPWVQERLNNILGCTINLGRKRRPETRGIVERFFRTLNDRGFNRITSTTGENIKDSRRRHPERDAVEYEIHLEQIEEILDVLIANYNATPHTGCFGLSPLDYLRNDLNENSQIHRTLPQQYREHLPLFEYQATCTVRGNIKKGRRPYIQLQGVQYTNEVLSSTPSFIGKKLTITPDKRDLRVFRSYFENGAFFGFLRASPPWNRVKHSLRTRKAIMKCIYNGKIARNSSDPIRAYHMLLSENAITKRRARSKLTHLERETKINIEPYVANKQSNKSHPPHAKGWIKIT